MAKYKKICTIIIAGIMMILSIIFIPHYAVTNPYIVAAFNNDFPTKEEYNLLKEYAISYARNNELTIIQDETIANIEKNLNRETLEVVVKSFKADVKASYPVMTEKTDDGKYETLILFNEGTYIEHCNINSISFYIGDILLVFFVFFAMGFFSLYLVFIILPCGVIKKVKKNK